jgi:hypothetical protein
MSLKRLSLIMALLGLFAGPQVSAQEDLSCADIQWSRVVTDQYPNIDDACNAVMMKNGQLFARISVEIQRVRNNNLTFRVLNRDGSSGGIYTQNVGTAWRANIGGNTYRARDLSRGTRLNVYLPPDRWAVVHEDDDGPDVEDAIPLAAAPMLPATASQWPLVGTIGAGLLLLGAGFTLLCLQSSRQVAVRRVERKR